MAHHMVIVLPDMEYIMHHAYDTPALHLYNRSYFLYLFCITCHTILWSRIASTIYIIPRTVRRKILTVENIDEFQAIRQYFQQFVNIFPIKIFHSVNYSYLALMNL